MDVIFEKSRPGRKGWSLPKCDVPAGPVGERIPEKFLRPAPPNLPCLGELDVVRHFTELSGRNFGVDSTFYPLGSCTMKYNPKVNEVAASLPSFAELHPYQPDSSAQGMLQLLYELERFLAEIAGLHSVSLQPAAGAHGELTSLMVIKAYHDDQGRRPTKILIPDSAHGTNPASSVICGYETVQLKSDSDGGVDLRHLEKLLSDDVAALMITNPNTLGLFDRNIKQITDRVHEAGGLVYLDGANMNAILGIVRPGDFGVDVMHYNPHKTFSTPHGGGGPGAGPIAVCERLASFLPVPVVEKEGNKYRLNWDRPKAIGKVRCFWGNIGVLIRAYTYILMQGPDGLRRVSENAILNANYLLYRLKDVYEIPYGHRCMHEFVISASPQKKTGARALDIAKRLLDFGFHPPTVYFPLIVPEALMIEPTETESKQTLDAFADALRAIAEEIDEDPRNVLDAPRSQCVRRLDEVRAARQLDLRWMSYPIHTAT